MHVTEHCTVQSILFDAPNIYLALSQTLLQESPPVWVTNGSHIKNISWLMVSKHSKVVGDQKLTNHKNSDADNCLNDIIVIPFFLESNFPCLFYETEI
jgi:hypothetical protein